MKTRVQPLRVIERNGSHRALIQELGVVGEMEDGRVVMSRRGLAVSYSRKVDSWTHGVGVYAGGCPDCGIGVSEPYHAGQPIEIASAFESDPERDDPSRVVSPVFQDAHRHDPPGAVGLLLTGNWFQHHFSAAVSLAFDTAGPQTAVFDVDVADRCRAAVEFFAATYVVRLDGGALLEAGPARIVWRVEGPTEGTLELVALQSSSLALAEAGRAAARVQIVAAIEPGKFTHRLRYQWRWASR